MAVRLLKALIELCHRWIDVVTMVTAVSGVVLYFYEAPERRAARDTAAWQILALQEDQTGNGGRRWAMETLVADRIELHGVRLVQADLSSGQGANGARLVGARLDWAVLWHSNLGGAHLHGAQLHHAALVCTVLSDADLSGADLSDADLSGTEVTAANFSGANLTGARLSQACIKKGGKLPAGLSGVVSRECPGWGEEGNGPCKGDLPRAGSAPASIAAR